ncbi:MAG: tRNA1(Val) (adenine(37)-N6)-methyltransferase [Desulfobacterales bacterium]|nr:tRNA1(Val) (adenine(37)-N6)-methyltransferase [Desulfobacterales bacterium]
MDHLTLDSLLDGRVRVKQSRAGYRFSLDAALLAFYAGRRPGGKVLDLGTGCGIIPLILSHRDPSRVIHAVEVQESLAELAALNVHDNGMDDRIVILAMDMKALDAKMTSGPVDLVVSNPPFRERKSGRINPNRERAEAMHEIRISLLSVIETAHRMLSRNGRFMIIYPAERLADLLTGMRSAGVEPKFLRVIHSRPDREARRVLVEGVKDGGRGVKIAPPLITHRENGAYTDEVERMLS